VKIADEDGKLIGALSQLAPGDRKTLALSGNVEKANVTAIDPSDSLVVATIQYAKPSLTIDRVWLWASLGRWLLHQRKLKPSVYCHPRTSNR